jgi:hypothetical protein
VTADPGATSLADRNRRRAVLAGLGLVQGAVLWAAHPISDESSPWVLSAVSFTLAAGLTGMFTWTGRDLARWLGSAVVLGAVVGAVTGWVWAQQPGHAATGGSGDAARIWTWFASAFTALYVLVPFAQIRQRSGRFRFPYPELFHHSWSNFFVGVIAQILTSAFALVITLWGQLFKLIGIEGFHDVFTSTAFLYLVYPAVAGYGVALGLEADRVTTALRRILFAVFLGLLPLLAALALLFAAALPFTSMQPLWDTGFATSLILSLLFALVLFANAVFQTGEGDPPYPRAVRWLVEAALVLLPLYFAIALYAIGLRVDQHGWTPTRVWAVVLILIGGCWSVGYALGIALRYRDWLATLRRVNVATALAIVALLIALHTPLGDPLRISVNGQVARLLSGRTPVAEFDYGFLRFEAGHLGRAALDALDKLESQPEFEGIANELATVRAMESYWAWKHGQSVAPDPDALVPIPPLAELPHGFVSLFSAETAQNRWRPCGSKAKPCAVFAVALDSEAPDELCVAARGGAVDTLTCYTRFDAAQWRRVGQLYIDRGPGPPAFSALSEALREEGAEPVAPRYRDVRIGESVYRFLTR